MKNFVTTLSVFAAIFSISATAAAISSVSFDQPTADTRINLQNVTKLYLQGNCDAAGDVISLEIVGQSPITTTCVAAKTWSFANISVASIADGPIQFKVSKSSDPTVAITRTFIKDTLSPILVINAPKNGDSIISSNFKSFGVSGLCSESGQPIQVTMKRAIADGTTPPIIQNLTCPSSLQWGTTFDLTALGDNTDVQLIAAHSDVSGNQTIQSASYYMDVQAISTGFAGLPAYINTTNAATLLLNGSCNKNNSYIVLAASVANTTYSQNLTTNCVNGRWAFNSMSFAGSTVPDGLVTLTLTLLNPLTGQMGSSTATLIKDVVPPTLTIASPASGYRMNATTGTTLTIAGACSENGRQVSISGTKSATATCTGGSYSVAVDYSSFADGDITVMVSHADAAANNVIQSLSFNKDVLPASLTVNPIAMINASNATTLQFTGTCSEFGAYAQPVVISGAISAQAICQPGGTWSLNLSSYSIADGLLSFVFDHKDAAGNAAPTITKVVSKDTVPPTMKIASPVIPALPSKFMINQANVNSVVFGGTCSKNAAVITATGAISGSTVCNSGNWSLTGASVNLASKADGDLAINFTITDASNNSLTQSLVVFKDTVAPTLTITGSPIKINIASTNNVVLSGSCSEYGSFAQPVTVTGVTGTLSAICNAPGNWTLTVAKTAFAEGASTLTVVHSDLAGNTTSVNAAVTKNSIPPKLTLATASGLTTVNATQASAFGLKGTCSENGQSVMISGAAAASTVCASGAWALNVNLSSLQDGNVSLAASHTDLSGNMVTQSLVLTKKTSLPTLTMTSPTDGQDLKSTTTFAFKGTCSENGQAVSISGGLTGSVACASGAWTLNLDVSKLTSDFSVTVQTADGVGNIASLSRALKNASAAPLLPPITKSRLAINTDGTHGIAMTCWIQQDTTVKCFGQTYLAQYKAPFTVPGLTGVASLADGGPFGGATSPAIAGPGCVLLTSGAVSCPNMQGVWTPITGLPANDPIVTIHKTGYYPGNLGGSYWAVTNSGLLYLISEANGARSPAQQITTMNLTVSAYSGMNTMSTTNVAAIYSWGQNTNCTIDKAGTVGCSTPSSDIPIKDLASFAKAVQFDASPVEPFIAGDHTCAVISNGIVRCEGSNKYGQLGNNSRTDSAAAVTVSNISNAKAIAVGRAHTCALLADGTVSCWGSNFFGQLGSSSTLDALTPVAVAGLSNIIEIKAGAYSTCALDAASQIRCWGSSYNYQTGVLRARLGSIVTPGSDAVQIDLPNSGTFLTSGSPIKVGDLDLKIEADGSLCLDTSFGMHLSCPLRKPTTVHDCSGGNCHAQFDEDPAWMTHSICLYDQTTKYDCVSLATISVTKGYHPVMTNVAPYFKVYNPTLAAIADIPNFPGQNFVGSPRIEIATCASGVAKQGTYVIGSSSDSNFWGAGEGPLAYAQVMSVCGSGSKISLIGDAWGGTAPNDLYFANPNANMFSVKPGPQ